MKPPSGQTYRHEIGGELLRIGRFSTNDLVLWDPCVSRTHAEITRRGAAYYILDVGGKLGTFVNDVPVEDPTLLRPGDRIRVGQTILFFNAESSPGVRLDDSLSLSASKIARIEPASLVSPFGTGSHAYPTPPFDEGDSPGGWKQLSATSLHSLNPDAVRIILDADRQLVAHRPLEEILERMMDLVARTVSFERGALLLLKDNRLASQIVRVQDAEPVPFRLSASIVRRVLQSGESMLLADAMADETLHGSESIQDLQPRSVMCVPLWNHREVAGVIYVDSSQEPGRYTRQDLLLVTHLAIIAGVKIQQQALIEEQIGAAALAEQLRKASDIQRALLPESAPDVPGYRLAGRSLPCYSVGGDSYQFLPIGEGRTVIGVADVSGKGLPAALLMCSFHATVCAVASTRPTLDEAISRLNRLVCGQVAENRYVTYFCGVLDAASGSFHYANAGHDPGLLLRADGTVQELPATGIPIGMTEDATYEIRKVRLRPDDVLLLYSDGATDERSPRGEFFGRERLIHTLQAARTDTPNHILHRIEKAILDHKGHSHQEDDITLVVLKRER